jgi:chorismate-pyruvate lyase
MNSTGCRRYRSPCAFMKIMLGARVTRRCCQRGKSPIGLMLRSVPHEFSSSAARQMVIAPSDEVGAAKAAATTRLPGSSLSRRYAIVITVQTKRRLRLGAPRKKPNLYP